jgi:hypothetical protein
VLLLVAFPSIVVVNLLMLIIFKFYLKDKFNLLNTLLIFAISTAVLAIFFLIQIYLDSQLSDEDVRRANEKLREQDIVNKSPEDYSRQSGQEENINSEEVIAEFFDLFSTKQNYNQA